MSYPETENNRFLARALGLAALWLAVLTPPLAADSSSGPQLFRDPANELEFFNVRHLRNTPRIVVPTLYVRMMYAGSAAPSDPAAEGATSLPVACAVDPAVARAVAGQLYADLVGRLRNAGWEVITHEDVRAFPAFSGLAVRDNDRRAGMPVDEGELSGERQYFLWASPDGMPVIEAGATGPIWAMRDVLRETGAGAMIVTYTFELTATPPDAEALSGTAWSGLRIGSVSAEFYTAELQGGGVKTKVPQAITGRLFETRDGTAADRDARRAAMREADKLPSAGSVIKRREAMVGIPDSNLLHDHAVAAGVAFNTVMVDSIAVYAPK